MLIPAPLLSALDAAMESTTGPALARAAEDLSAWYRGGRAHGDALRWNPSHYVAYAVTRMPATFAAVSAVLVELARHLPPESVGTALDLCAGPGTAAWALSRAFPAIRETVLVERDPGFVELGRRLASNGPQPLARAEWIEGDVAQATLTENRDFDVVTATYGFGELRPAGLLTALDNAWACTRAALVIVEPGTPAGFRTILACRRRLIDAGAHIAAPCPHALDCPLAVETGRWCHFSRRLARQRAHRMAKGADLGYEDERFAYVIATRKPPAQTNSRIIGYPRTTKAGVTLELCAHGGIRRELIPKRSREAYRRARGSRWGDPWE
jgi:ribosomal protein RSM22 (predicted rRNA methylase)